MYVARLEIPFFPFGKKGISKLDTWLNWEFKIINEFGGNLGKSIVWFHFFATEWSNSTSIEDLNLAGGQPRGKYIVSSSSPRGCFWILEATLPNEFNGFVDLKRKQLCQKVDNSVKGCKLPDFIDEKTNRFFEN